MIFATYHRPVFAHVNYLVKVPLMLVSISGGFSVLTLGVLVLSVSDNPMIDLLLLCSCFDTSNVF